MPDSKLTAASDRLRVVVLGYLVRGPLGGMAWHHLQYVIGLDRLGHDVYFLEDSGDTEWSCYDPRTGINGRDPSYGLSFARAAFDRLGLGERWCYYDAHTSTWLGPAAQRVSELARSSDLLLNVSFSNPIRPWAMEIPMRVGIDTDPAFTQIRNLADDERRRFTARHTKFFSFAENLAAGRSTIPDDGVRWNPTRQPIDLGSWPVTPGPRSGRFTTVMQWDSYATREYKGRQFGMKSSSFAPFRDLPLLTSSPLEIALGSPNAPREELESRGWILSNPLEVARDPWSYRGYIQSSKAEFTVAKSGYVITNSGWFSERSAAYLASARPVVTQETGFSDLLPTGSGLLSYRDLDGALAALESVASSYESHCVAAREIAQDCFDSSKVLKELLAVTLESSPTRRAEM